MQLGPTHNVSHDAELVQGGLSVKQHNVPVDHVSLHHVPKPQLLGHLIPVSVLQEPSGGESISIGTRVCLLMGTQRSISRLISLSLFEKTR